MDEHFSREFAQFLKDKLQPAVVEVNAKKRSTFLRALGAGLGFFVMVAGAVYFLMAPYRKLMQEYSLTYWPVMLLVPLAVAMVVFSITYILGLRTLVNVFRDALVNRLAEFIDPGMVHENQRPLAETTLRDSLFLRNLKPHSGSDCFRGRIGAAAVEIVPLQATVKQGGDTEEALHHGVFLNARMERPFPAPVIVTPLGVEVSRSGLEDSLRGQGVAAEGGLVREEAGGRQVLSPAEGRWYWEGRLKPETLRRLEEARKKKGAEFYLSCRETTLSAALLSDRKRLDYPRIFDEMDFMRCQEFCADAELLAAVARDMGE